MVARLTNISNTLSRYFRNAQVRSSVSGITSISSEKVLEFRRNVKYILIINVILFIVFLHVLIT